MMKSSFLIAFTLILLVLYGVLLLIYRQLWQKLPSIDKGQTDKLPSKSQYTRFSIIIPARNEARNIGNCLESILKGDYPPELYEVIVVDDFSEDATLEILHEFQRSHPGQVKVIELRTLMQDRPINSYKKKAIELAIAQATGNWIVTTDADCKVPEGWLHYYNQYILQTAKRFIAAPVKFEDNGSFVSKFQCLDFLSLQGVTGAAVGGRMMSMCNGANLAYEKAFFYEVEGFSGIDRLASGDDMFLMGKMQAKQPGSTGYLFAREAVVTTLPMADWASFLHQRIRWASKAGSYKDWKIKAVLLLVYLLNLSLVVLFIWGIFQPALLLSWLVLLLFKFFAELFFLWPVAGFFNERNLLAWFLVMQPVHLLYTVVAGWLGLFGKYQWKGRQVR